MIRENINQFFLFEYLFEYSDTLWGRYGTSWFGRATFKMLSSPIWAVVFIMNSAGLVWHSSYFILVCVWSVVAWFCMLVVVFSIEKWTWFRMRMSLSLSFLPFANLFHGTALEIFPLNSMRCGQIGLCFIPSHSIQVMTKILFSLHLKLFWPWCHNAIQISKMSR